MTIRFLLLKSRALLQTFERRGSSSPFQVSPFKVVPMEKEVQTSLMHHHRFGEGACFTNKASQALSERIVPTFYMGSLPCFLSHGFVLLLRDHGLIRCPKIGEAVTSTVDRWNGLP